MDPKVKKALEDALTGQGPCTILPCSDANYGGPHIWLDGFRPQPGTNFIVISLE